MLCILLTFRPILKECLYCLTENFYEVLLSIMLVYTLLLLFSNFSGRLMCINGVNYLCVD